MVFPRLVRDQVNRADTVLEYASGKGVNVARVVRTLGEDALAVGFAGGTRGRQLLTGLDRFGVTHDFAPCQAETRLCSTLIDRFDHTATELVEETAPVEAAAWDALDRTILSRGPACAGWVLAGSLPPGAPVDRYASWIAAGARAGATVVLDGRGPVVPAALALGAPFILKCNAAELATTVGHDLPDEPAILAAMARVCAPGGGVVISRGAAGALARIAGRNYHIAVPHIRPLNPIGSGDSMTAALTVALVRRQGVPDALAFAAAAGTANALTLENAQVNPDDIHRLLADITVAPL